MRHLPLFLLLFLSSFLSAQCFINVSFLESECAAGGDEFFVNFTVQGGGDNTWTSPTLGVSGAYNTDSVFRAGPFANDAFETILFQDAQDAACFNVYDTPLPDCPTSSCEDFAISAFADDISFCESGEVWSFYQTGGQFPVTIRIINSSGEQVLEELFETPEGISFFIDEGAYSVIMTDADGCTASTVIQVAARNCTSVEGFSWLDSDGDGIQDVDEVGLSDVTFQLFDDGGNLVSTVRSGGTGVFLFGNLLPGTYTIRAGEQSTLTATTCCQGDECANSDFDPATLTTLPITLADGETNTCIDAGWIQTSRISGFSWLDENGDGLRTNGEDRVDSAVELLVDGQPIASTGTNANGFYSFSGISPGSGYAVRFSPPELRTPVTPGASNGISCLDSEINLNTLTTEEFDVFTGGSFGCLNAGWETLPCESFEIYLFNEFGDEFNCSPDVLIIVGTGRLVTYPIFVEVIDTATEMLTLRDTIRNPNGGFYEDLPSGVYRFNVTNEEGCSFTDVINAERGEGCGFVSGSSWRDDNENGILDEQNSALSTRVELLSNGVVIAEAQTFWGGNYSFSGLPVGDYQLRFAAPSGFQGTIKDANGGLNDSGVEPSTNLSDIFTVPPGGGVDTINAGWVRTFECSEFLLNLELEQNNQGCGSTGEYTASVAVAALPVDYYLINPFSRDTLQTITISEIGAEVSFDLSQQGSYLIAARDVAGCTDERLINAFESNNLSVRINQSSFDCTGNEEIILTATVFPENPNYTYIWSNGVTGPILTGAQIGQTYDLLVGNETSGCTGQGRIFVSGVLHDTLSIVEFPNPIIIGCGQDSVLIEPDTIIAGFTYRWFRSQTLFHEGPSFYATEAGFYQLEAVSENGCVISGRARVENQSLEGQFIELFEWTRTDECGTTLCIGLETSVPFGENSPFTVTWQGPTQQFTDFANQSTNNNFCEVDPGLYQVTVTSECDTIRRSLFVEEALGCSSISGTLWVDQAADCDLDPEDTVVPQYVITLTNQGTGEMFYAMTDENGNWTANVPLGEYIIEPTLDPQSPFGTCPTSPVTLGSLPVTGVQLFLPAENACAQLSTTATMPFLRRCFSNQAFVEYENRGSVTAIDAELVVVLDDFFDNVVPDRPFTSREGNTFTFDLGDLDPFEAGTIRFNFVVSCESTLGQAHCLEASIKPDEPCNPDENWNGALVQVEAVGCDGDSVRFDIVNVGLDQMSIPLTYIIIEDGIMLSPAPLINGFLLPEEVMSVVLPSNGSSYQVVTNQEPDAPAFEDPTAVVEGCNVESGGFSTGFTNILPLNNGLLSSTTVCRENVGAYDPNDKTGYPLGFGDDNEINAGTRLDYAIRFQNTGTDTAFTVIIRDTLPEELDLATLKLDAASHDFVATLDSNRMLTFVFENILLPDSTTNLAASQGVVQFSIDHAAALLPGAIIRNEAAIYFDFNEPIITNKTRHVITKDGLPVGTRAELAQQVALKVFPNPTDGVLNVRIPLADVGLNDQLQVTDLYGRTLATTTYARASAGWNLSHLPAGYYLVVVTDAAGRPRGRTGFVVAK